MAIHIRRREVIALFGGAASWPLNARAQQGALPAIGFLHPASLEAFAENLRGYRQGLKETGYIEGENVHSSFVGLTVSSIDWRSLRPISFVGVLP